MARLKPQAHTLSAPQSSGPGAVCPGYMISGAGMLDFLACHSIEKLVIDAEAIASAQRFDLYAALRVGGDLVGRGVVGPEPTLRPDIVASGPMRFYQINSPVLAFSACTVFEVLERKITPSCTMGVTSTAPPSFIAQDHLS